MRWSRGLQCWARRSHYQWGANWAATLSSAVDGRALCRIADGEAYDEMIRRHRQVTAKREGASAPPDGPHGPVDAIAAGIAHVLDGPREARREVVRGHVFRGLIDGATAAADLEFGRSAVSGIRRGSVKLSGSHSWGATRKWLGRAGLAEKNQQMHHALIPNSGWGKEVPEVIKNQPWNLKATESPLHHTRIHGRSLKFGLSRFNAAERYWHGTSTWWKAANGSAAGHAVQAIADHLPHHSQPARPGHPSQKK